MRATVLAVLLLAGCAARPPVPDWQGNAHGALQAAVAATLNGETRVADAEMARARSEVARTGRPALLARAELVLCAARVASLDFDGCPAYAAVAVDAEAQEAEWEHYGMIAGLIIGFGAVLGWLLWRNRRKARL